MLAGKRSNTDNTSQNHTHLASATREVGLAGPGLAASVLGNGRATTEAMAAELSGTDNNFKKTIKHILTHPPFHLVLVSFAAEGRLNFHCQTYVTGIRDKMMSIYSPRIMMMVKLA